MARAALPLPPRASCTRNNLPSRFSTAHARRCPSLTPRCALGHLKPGGPKLPSTGKLVARAAPVGLACEDPAGCRAATGASTDYQIRKPARVGRCRFSSGGRRSPRASPPGLPRSPRPSMPPSRRPSPETPRRHRRDPRRRRDADQAASPHPIRKDQRRSTLRQHALYRSSSSSGRGMFAASRSSAS